MLQNQFIFGIIEETRIRPAELVHLLYERALPYDRIDQIDGERSIVHVRA